MYYKLEPKFVNDTVMIDKASHKKYSLTLGEALPHDIPLPFKFKIDTDINNHTYLPVTFLPEPVFSNDLIQALLGLGVDNFDTYETQIINPDTGETIEGYRAINIIGKVSCADMGLSNSERLIEDQHIFRKLVIKPTDVHNLLFFRLAEWTQVILCHESIIDGLPEHLVKDFKLDLVDENN